MPDISGYNVARRMMPKLAQVALFSIGLALVSVMYGDQLLSRAGWGCLIVATVWILGKSSIKTGNKMIAYPLIALAILSGLQGVDIISRVMPAILIGVYLVSTRIGKAAFVPAGMVATLGGIVLIAQNLIVGAKGGAFFTATIPGAHPNYNVAIGAILLGAILWQSKWQWLVVTLAAVAVIVSGADEGLIALVLLIIAMIIRKDWSSKRTAITVMTMGAAALVVVLFYPQLWQSLLDKFSAASNSNYDEALNGRLEAYKFAVQDISWLGHGYNPFRANYDSIHSVPLIALQQTGIVGLGLWLWVIGYGIFKTRMKYAFTIVLGLSLFDNYLWTYIAAYTWAIAGAASTAKDSDLIFRKEHIYASSKLQSRAYALPAREAGIQDSYSGL